MFVLLLASLAIAQDSLPSYEDLLPDTPTFPTARKRMYLVHEGQPTLYCGCDWKDKVVDLDTCGLGSFSSTYWSRTEAEHVVPASTIGATTSCWTEGGRSHCLKTDPVFAKAHNDLHNLYPAVGQINRYRSNNIMGLISEEEREWGDCDFEVDVDADRAEPRTSMRGDIARIHFYMEWMHGVALTKGQRRLFLHWHQTDPVSDWERIRDDRIRERQGNSNPFVR